VGHTEQQYQQENHRHDGALAGSTIIHAIGIAFATVLNPAGDCFLAPALDLHDAHSCAMPDDVSYDTLSDDVTFGDLGCARAAILKARDAYK
jgi:hypothetical protein